MRDFADEAANERQAPGITRRQFLGTGVKLAFAAPAVLAVLQAGVSQAAAVSNNVDTEDQSDVSGPETDTESSASGVSGTETTNTTESSVSGGNSSNHTNSSNHSNTNKKPSHTDKPHTNTTTSDSGHSGAHHS